MSEQSTVETGPALHDRFAYPEVPYWFNRAHGVMYVTRVNIERRRMELTNSAAKLTIYPIRLGPGEWQWGVMWRIRHSRYETVK